MLSSLLFVWKETLYSRGCGHGAKGRGGAGEGGRRRRSRRSAGSQLTSFFYLSFQHFATITGRAAKIEKAKNKTFYFFSLSLSPGAERGITHSRDRPLTRLFFLRTTGSTRTRDDDARNTLTERWPKKGGGGMLANGRGGRDHWGACEKNFSPR